MFFKRKQYLFDQNTVQIILWNIITIQIIIIYFFKCNSFLWCKIKFSVQFLLSHDPSEIILICWFAA